MAGTVLGPGAKCEHDCEGGVCQAPPADAPIAEVVETDEPAPPIWGDDEEDDE